MREFHKTRGNKSTRNTTTTTTNDENKKKFDIAERTNERTKNLTQ